MSQPKSPPFAAPQAIAEASFSAIEFMQNEKVRQQATEGLKSVRESCVGDVIDNTLEAVKRHPGTGLTVDGRVLSTVQPEDRIRVRKIEPRFKLVVAPRHSYYKTLREKLGWGGRLPPRNRP